MTSPLITSGHSTLGLISLNITDVIYTTLFQNNTITNHRSRGKLIISSRISAWLSIGVLFCCHKPSWIIPIVWFCMCSLWNWFHLTAVHLHRFKVTGLPNQWELWSDRSLPASRKQWNMKQTTGAGSMTETKRLSPCCSYYWGAFFLDT